MLPSSYFFFFFFLLSPWILLPAIDASPAPAPAPIQATTVVDRVCKEASDYWFCVDSLYSDDRTPRADQYSLAFVSVGLASNYASDTQNLISDLLKNASSTNDYRNLKACLEDYDKIRSYISMANNDLNSETFFDLADYASKASGCADHCGAAFPSPPLPERTRDLKALCQIFGIIGKLFSGGGGGGDS